MNDTGAETWGDPGTAGPGWDGAGADGSRRGSGLRTFALIAIGALLAVLVGGIGVVFGLGLGRKQPTPVQTPAPVATEQVTADPVAATQEPERDELENDELGNDELAERYGASVFKVETEGCGMAGWGTAWVLDDQHLVTNWHVVSNDLTPELVSRDGSTRLAGTVIGGQAEPDVAVIRVSEELPEALPWADTDDLREGEEIVSLGFPAPAGDFSVTPSTIISFQRSGTTREAIRGDGALDRGNSGGPALTRDGEVAGVATLMIREANQLQMVPLLFTADALERTVEDIVHNPGEVEPECDPQYAQLPDDWAPDFDDWSSEGPQTYGDDAALDRLWDACAGGDLGACDDLFVRSPYGSDYEAFSISCGETGVGPAYGMCETYGEWEAQEAEWEAEQRREEQARASLIAQLLTDCQGGDMQACDDLQYEADYGSREYSVADECGGYYPDGWASCVDRQAEAAGVQALVGACQAGDMQACDDLFWASSSGSPEEAVASDCGGFYPGWGGMCVYQEENP